MFAGLWLFGIWATAERLGAYQSLLGAGSSLDPVGVAGDEQTRAMFLSDPIAVPDDAPPLDKLAALLGRQP